jgi:hypothetical protein
MADKNFSIYSGGSFDTYNSSINSIRYSPTHINELKPKSKLKKDALEYVDYYKEYKSDPKYKTEMCKSWSESGFCAYGNKCRFAHGKSELFEKIVACKNYKQKDCMSFFKNKYCCYGSRCHFRHQERKIQEMHRSYYNYLLCNLSNTSDNFGDIMELDSEILMLLMAASKPAKNGSKRLNAFNTILLQNQYESSGESKVTHSKCSYNIKSIISRDSNDTRSNSNHSIPGLGEKDKMCRDRDCLSNSDSSIENSDKSENFSLSYRNYNILPLF